MTRLVRLVAACSAAIALAGGVAACSDDKSSQASAGDGPKDVQTTRVEVVKGLGAKGGLNASQLYDRLSPGVVTVLSLFDTSGSALGEGAGGQGSGFVLDGDGYIATNAHVVTSGDPPKTKTAKEVYVEFSDGNRVQAKVVGTDLNSDVALLKIPTSGLKLTKLSLGRSRDLTVGQPVAAIGSPFGERQSLSVGVVSATDRTIDSLTAFKIGNAIQTDAAINPGNSGGPLLDSRGRVIGINSQIKSTSGGGEGVGFAIPIDSVSRSLGELRRKGHVDYGYLGVTSQPIYPQLARRLGIDASAGGLVAAVQDGSPAKQAGLRAGTNKIKFQGQRDIPSGGDVILAVSGRKLTQHDDLSDVISGHDAGDEVSLDVERGGKRRTVKLKLASRPDKP